ncbi:fumarate hydratase C-terminal domain-containing protein [Shigella flexneri]
MTDACKKHGSSFLAVSVVRPLWWRGCVPSLECVEYAALGMEVIWKIGVEDFPAFPCDDKEMTSSSGTTHGAPAV